MAHISELTLFDYVSGKGDLSTEETEHVRDCDDCRDEVIALRRVVQDSADIEKTRRFLAEEGKLPLATEPPKEVHEVQRELDERSGS
jgi:hypothetical protein